MFFRRRNEAAASNNKTKGMVLIPICKAVKCLADANTKKDTKLANASGKQDEGDGVPQTAGNDECF